MKICGIGFIGIVIFLFCNCNSNKDKNHYLNKFSDELNLQRLENGVDSFELRFGARIGVLKCRFGQLLVIKKIQNRWTCLEYNYIVNDIPFGSYRGPNDYVKKFSIDTISIVERKPKSEWSNFFEQLENENIYNLPSMMEIPSWDSLGVEMCDGTAYSVEFADKQRHRHYTYNTPKLFAKDFRECENMASIIEIFDREIGVKDSIEEILAAYDRIHGP